MTLTKTQTQPPMLAQAVVAVAIDPPECNVAAVEVLLKVAAAAAAAASDL